MEQIDKKMNNLLSVEVPVGMHQFVMRRVSYQKTQPVIFVTFILLVLNFIVIAWHINAKLIDAEFVDMVQDFLEVFSFNIIFINTVLGSFFEIISPLLVVSAVLSLAGAIYTGKKIDFYNFAKV